MPERSEFTTEVEVIRQNRSHSYAEECNASEPWHRNCILLVLLVPRRWPPAVPAARASGPTTPGSHSPPRGESCSLERSCVPVGVCECVCMSVSPCFCTCECAWKYLCLYVDTTVCMHACKRVYTLCTCVYVFICV